MSSPASEQATTTWWEQAACRGLPLDWFVPPGDAFDDDEEPWDPDPRAARACAGCPVRPECLAFALRHPELRGTWGGLSWHRRRQTKRVRHRQACPGCGATTAARVDSGQVCIGCGLSWRTSSR